MTVRRTYASYNPQPRYGYRMTHICCSHGRTYGLSNLVGDLVLTGLTFGLWLIWIIIREVSR